jgi:hypothetical protein
MLNNISISLPILIYAYLFYLIYPNLSIHRYPVNLSLYLSTFLTLTSLLTLSFFPLCLSLWSCLYLSLPYLSPTLCNFIPITAETKHDGITHSGVQVKHHNFPKNNITACNPFETLSATTTTASTTTTTTTTTSTSNIYILQINVNVARNVNPTEGFCFFGEGGGDK